MKKLLLMTLVASGLALVQSSDAQISIGIGHPGYGYGYYPYGYYRSYSYYRTITDLNITGITGIEFTTTTIIITIAIGRTKDTKETRTNNKAPSVASMRVSNEDCSPA
jgi:hypothetical protein